MSTIKFFEYEDVIRFTLNWDEGDPESPYEAIKKVFAEFEARYGARNVPLSTFVAEGAHDELDFFLFHGFYVHNTLLYMSLDGAKETAVEIPDDLTLEISHEITKEYTDANAEGFEAPSMPRWELEKKLKLPEGALYMLRKDGKIVSSAMIWKDADAYVLANVFTVPEQREKHYARVLLNKVISDVFSKETERLTLTVYADNVEALGLYYRLGFTTENAVYEVRY